MNKIKCLDWPFKTFLFHFPDLHIDFDNQNLVNFVRNYPKLEAILKNFVSYRHLKKKRSRKNKLKIFFMKTNLKQFILEMMIHY